MIEVYVDGSKVGNSLGAGIVLCDKSKIILERGVNITDMCLDNSLELSSATAELIATVLAVTIALQLGIKRVRINYDYKFIHEFIIRKRSDNRLGKLYIREMCKLLPHFEEVKFRKIKAHSGLKYNELADNLAKRGAKNVRRNL